MRAALLLLAVLLAAGCVEAPAATQAPAPDAIRPVLFEGMISERTPIKSFDGVLLDAWVYRPDAGRAGEKVPVIINFSPYWSNLAPPAATGGDAFSLYLLDFFVPRGYAVALVSARGTGQSEGCFTIGGPTELKDEDAVATFLAEQPWANGNVTATGKSYDGTMAQGLLAMGNPHVRTIVPVSPISELYKYTYFDAVPYANFNFNSYYVAQTSLFQGDDTRGQTPTRFCDESIEVQSSQYHSFATGDYTPYWQARNYSALLPEKVDASVFYVHGLSDWNVKPDNMDPWIEELRARGVTVKMWLGDWEHEYPTRADFNATLLRWLDHYLKGIDTGILDEPLVQVQDRDGVWRDEDAWPPERATDLTLFLDAGGKLSAAPGSGSGMYADRADAGPLLGPLKYAWTADRDLRIVGAPLLHAKVSATGPRATLSVVLAADGKVIGQGFRDLAHRTTLATTQPMTPGTAYDVDVHFYPQDVLVKKGQTLTLTVSHAPARGAPVGVMPIPTGALVTVDHAGTALRLRVLDASDVRPELPQPVDVGCWAC